jgi:predicted MPP superfamily phosphohydrolase
VADAPPGLRDARALNRAAYGPSDDVLERSWLHRLLVWSSRPAAWPAVATTLLLALLIGGAGLFWWLVADGAAGLIVAAVLAACIGGDTGLLHSLPRRRVSFGPVASQVVVLAAPRLIAAAAPALVAPLFGLWPAVVLAAAFNLAASAALVWAAAHEPAHVGASQRTLTVPWLAPESPPLRLVQVTDVHVERLGRREAAVVQQVSAARPDLVLLVGDYVNLSGVCDPTAHSHARQFLLNLCDGAGSGNVRPAFFAVLGSPPVDRNSAPLFDGLPIRLLRDEVVVIQHAGRQALALLGMDCYHAVAADTARLERLAAAVPPGLPMVLLYHSPDLMPAAVRLGIHLYLCGHTHGGQVRLPGYGAVVTSSWLGKRYEMGYYREGDTHLYVCRGIGFEGLGAPRVRFLCPPEVVMWTLTPHSAHRTQMNADKTLIGADK